MGSWAFATSPHGLGLTTEQFWGYTPREAKALEKIAEAPLHRWAAERAHFFNAHQMTSKGQEFKPWHAHDFFDTPEARRVRAMAERDEREFQAAKIAEKQELWQMKAGKFDESQLPGWARMTPAEKQKRGIN